MRDRSIALTMGDPRGVGPELGPVAARRLLAADPEVSVVLIGPEGTCPEGLPYHAVGRFDGSEASAGLLAAWALEEAVRLALAGEVGAVVTGPVSKPALRAGGYEHPGQTEMLGELTGAAPVGMLMAAERTRVGAPLRVLLATTHLPLRDVPARLTRELLLEQTRLLASALRRDWRIEEPRIALCALNPHASDGGIFGDEEARILVPAAESLTEEGVSVTGPVPADTVFERALRGEFDAVVAPYHDVGMAAFKTVSFGTGVNVTLGLPFVRTSPDHGTAVDLAGTGRADPSSTFEALRLALHLARNRFTVPRTSV